MLTKKTLNRHELTLLILLFSLAGCQSPFLVFPGGALDGEAGKTENFSFAREYRTLQLEVDSDDPYSVILRTTVIDGELYIDAAKSRRWSDRLAEDSKVRIKLGDRIYHAAAEVVNDPEITDRFLPGRTIYRINPVR